MASDRKSYECDASAAHEIQTGANYKPLAGTRCLGYWLGSPCKGILWQTSAGYVAANKAAKARLDKEGKGS